MPWRMLLFHASPLICCHISLLPLPAPALLFSRRHDARYGAIDATPLICCRHAALPCFRACQLPMLTLSRHADACRE